MSKKRPPMHSGGIKQAKNHKEMPCFLPKITIFVPDHTDRNMKKAITIIFLTVLSVLNLSAAEIDSLFSRWEESVHRIRGTHIRHDVILFLYK